jgi:hypothetical protein
MRKNKMNPAMAKTRVASVMTFPISLSDNAFVQPIDPRRRPEINDSRMIREDHTAMANLPTMAINRQWNPGKFMPHYWMESEVEPVGVHRYNEPTDE